MKNVIFSESKTFRSEVLARYMTECNKFKVMDNDEIIAALANGQSERVINANLKLVISVAKGYQGLGLTLDDLIQEGNIGLCIAAQMYDVSRGTMFTTCALQYIVKYITQAITDKGRVVRLPKHMTDTAYLAVSMDASLGSDEDGNDKCLLDTFASDSRTDKGTDIEAIKHTIKVLMKGLDERERNIICGLFGLGCTEVSAYTLAKRYGLTEERVRQIKVAAIEKMAQLA
jgi:RNA polymerase primary sigma factor